MNKFFKTAVILTLAVFAFSSALSVLAAKGSGKNLEKDLGKGTKNDDVEELQKKLSDEGFFSVSATGFFGPITEKAVKEFQKAKGLPETGFVGPLTRNELNKQDEDAQSISEEPKSSLADIAKIEKLIDDLREKINLLQEELQKQILALAKTQGVTPEAQAKAGIIITGGVSGPGYPTGPLNVVLPATQLLFDKVGQVKAGGTEVKGRQYEIPIDDTIPPTGADVPITINGVANVAGVKVISNLKTKNGVGQHQGTIDVDVDVLPTPGHVTLAYNGTATVVGSTITSKGTFKTAKTTGIFAGLIAEGTYEMTIIESGTVFGSPVTVSITTVSP